jgi:hypothetical protein
MKYDKHAYLSLVVLSMYSQSGILQHAVTVAAYFYYHQLTVCYYISWKGSVQLYLFTEIEHMQYVKLMVLICYGCSVGHCHTESVAISNGGKDRQFKKPQIL